MKTMHHMSVCNSSITTTLAGAAFGSAAALAAQLTYFYLLVKDLSENSPVTQK